MSKNLALDNYNLIPDFFPTWFRQIQFTGVMIGCLLENITAARNKFTTGVIPVIWAPIENNAK